MATTDNVHYFGKDILGNEFLCPEIYAPQWTCLLAMQQCFKRDFKVDIPTEDILDLLSTHYSPNIYDMVLMTAIN